MNDEQCVACTIYVAQPLQECAHCRRPYCARHMIEHDKKIVFELRTIPQLVKNK